MNQNNQSENLQQPIQSITPTAEVTSNRPRPSTSSLPQTIVETPKERNKLLIILLVIIILGFLGYWIYQKYIVQKPTSISSPKTLPTVLNVPNNQSNLKSNSFCGKTEYCSMVENCANLPESHGECESGEICDKLYICGRAEELLNNFAMETLFIENIQKMNEKTQIGYLLVRNTDTRSRKDNITSLECLNYKGLCQNINIIYPTSFKIMAKDVIIFPVYIEKDSDLTGLVSLEFTFQIDEKPSMISVDVIFNGDKVCIYQWGVLDKTLKEYFNEPSKVDWTKYCQ